MTDIFTRKFKPLKQYLLIGFVFLFQNVTKAQIILPLDNTSQFQSIFLNVSLEPELVATIGYRYKVGSWKNDTNVYLGGSIKFAPLIISNGAWRSNFTQGLDIKVSENWIGVFSNDIYLAHNKNRAGTMDGLGFDLRGSLNHHSGKWSKGIELGWQYTAFTHIIHSDEVKATFQEIYPDPSITGGPIDGWYSSTASRFRIGFLAGKRLNNHMTFQLGIGSILSVQKQGILVSFAHGQVPLYFNTQLNYMW